MSNTIEMIKNGVRVDGRKLNEMRPMEARVGVLKKAEGSAMFRMGNTLAIAGVFGPRRVYPKHEEDAERAVLRTQYRMSPFATNERSRPGINRRSQEISMVTREALKSMVFLDEFPKTAIDVHIEILQADASTRCAGINAASLALADAGIPMRDLVSSCSAGKVQNTIVLDVAGKEDTEGDLDCAISYYKKWNQITHLQMDGIATKEETKKIIALAIEGCNKVYEIQKQALKNKYNLEGQGE